MAEKLNIHWSEKAETLQTITDVGLGVPFLIKPADEVFAGSELDQAEIVKVEPTYVVNGYRLITPDGGLVTDAIFTSDNPASIPLTHSGRGAVRPIFGEAYVYSTVGELMLGFPRFVCAEDELRAPVDGAEALVAVNDTVELLRVVLLDADRGRPALRCRRGDDVLTLSPDTGCRFRALPDRNEYTVKGVLKHLKLPQIIDFFESPGSYLQGPYVLENVSRSKCIFTRQKRGAHLCFNVTAEPLKDAKFHFAGSNDFKDLIFTVPSKNKQQGDGTDSRKTQRWKTILSAINKKSKSVGDLSSSAKTPSSSNDDPTSASDDDDDDYVFPPEEFSGSGSPADTKPSEKSKAHVSKLDQIKRFADKVPQKMKTSKDFVFNNLKTKLHVKEEWDIPKPKRVSTKDEFENEYQYPDISKIMNEIHEEEQKEEQEKKYKRFPTDTMAKNIYIEMKTRGHLTQSKIASRPPMPLPKNFSSSTAQPLLAVKPILSVKPQVLPEEAANDSSSKEQSKRLIEATVTELCKVLKTCGLFNLEKICEKNKLDGKFISSLSEEDLKKLPFNLNDLEIIKIRMMLKGWTPKVT